MSPASLHLMTWWHSPSGTPRFNSCASTREAIGSAASASFATRRMCRPRLRDRIQQPGSSKWRFEKSAPDGGFFGGMLEGGGLLHNFGRVSAASDRESRKTD